MGVPVIGRGCTLGVEINDIGVADAGLVQMTSHGIDGLDLVKSWVLFVIQDAEFMEFVIDDPGLFVE